jgi:hypothetical protein
MVPQQRWYLNGVWDDSYGNEVTATQSPLNGATDLSVSAGITGLNPNITYHYRVKAENSLGTTYGSDQTFTTPGGCTFGHHRSGLLRDFDLGNPERPGQFQRRCNHRDFRVWAHHRIWELRHGR